MILKRLAIVGLGSIGRRHLRLIKQIRPEVELVLVRSGRGEAWPEEQLATTTVHSIRAALSEGIQAAIISSPTSIHLEQAVELADSNIHMLIEKPLSHTPEGIDKLLSIVKQKKLVALVGYVLRYDPGANRFKQWLSDENIGELLHVRIECGSYLPDWRPEQDYRKTISASPELGGGVVLELSHELDYLHWFFGKPAEVQARLRNSKTLGLEVEDQADLLLANRDGHTISIQLDFCRRLPQRRCVAQTTKGQLTWDAINKQVTWESGDNQPVIDEFSFDRDYIYQKQLTHFLECIEKGSKPIVSLENGADVMHLIDAVYRANDSSRKVIV